MRREGYYVYWPHAGFPTTITGPHETPEQAWDEIASYTGPEKTREAAYVMKYEMMITEVPRRL
jgi:hypothetical protein